MSKNSQIPHHVAIVMDGNGRWANKRLLPRTAGHREGVKAVRSTIEACANAGVKVLTLFAFSSENWNRPKTEVMTLMDLFVSSLEKEVNKLNENGIRLKFIGDRSRFHQKLQDKIEESERITANNEQFLLNIAANYGGRWDIVTACKNICQKVQKQQIRIEDITESEFSNHLSTGSIPDPDLFIRTAGEQRVSNFLIWQMAYTEFYYTDVFWPEFDKQQFQLALEEYGLRKRKFGLTQEQIETGTND
ncbi:MAG: isoprenyl transferase [Gammaproteobacteria bacterium]|nr:isoprenyl transferase [Gammaproteobacteria bacterium]